MPLPIGWLFLALGAGAVLLLGKGMAPAKPGTLVMEGTVGELAVRVVQQTTTSLQWEVTGVGAGAGTYDQNPLGAMLELAFAEAGPDAPVTLTYLASGMADPHAQAHGDVTLSVYPEGDVWHWSVADDAHDVVAIGEKPSRGAAILAAEESVAGHLGLSLDALGAGGGASASEGAEAHGARFPDCAVRVFDPVAWQVWARERVRGAFDAASGLPSADDLLDAVVGQAMADAGAPECPIDDLVLGTQSWSAVEPKIAGVLGAIDDGTLLSIPGPDELIASALGGLTADNRGTKESFGTWSIVVRPTDEAGAKAFAWWAWHGARLLDSDADLQGFGETQDEALALAKTAVQAQPADVQAEGS